MASRVPYNFSFQANPFLFGAVFGSRIYFLANNYFIRRMYYFNWFSRKDTKLAMVLLVFPAVASLALSLLEENIEYIPGKENYH